MKKIFFWKFLQKIKKLKKCHFWLQMTKKKKFWKIHSKKDFPNFRPLKYKRIFQSIFSGKELWTKKKRAAIKVRKRTIFWSKIFLMKIQIVKLFRSPLWKRILKILRIFQQKKMSQFLRKIWKFLDSKFWKFRTKISID